VAFTEPAGSGAWGPSLREGRALIQFPAVEDHVEFVVTGTDDHITYGINGLGTGRMPGFGEILSLEDIELIVAFERSL
jgi:mono/diheme cytochrome c family protein